MTNLNLEEAPINTENASEAFTGVGDASEVPLSAVHEITEATEVDMTPEDIKESNNMLNTIEDGLIDVKEPIEALEPIASSEASPEGEEGSSEDQKCESPLNTAVNNVPESDAVPIETEDVKEPVTEPSTTENTPRAAEESTEELTPTPKVADEATEAEDSPAEVVKTEDLECEVPVSNAHDATEAPEAPIQTESAEEPTTKEVNSTEDSSSSPKESSEAPAATPGADIPTKDEKAESSEDSKDSEASESLKSSSCDQSEDGDKECNGMEFDTRPDYEEALEKLEKITAGNKRLLDDPGAESERAQKRTLNSPTEEVDGKRPKLDVELDADLSETKEKLQTLNKQELEDLVAQLLAENLAATSELGGLRRKCETAERKLEKWQTKALLYQKQLADLTHVVTKYVTDVKSSEASSGNVNPVKLTRSVGLQVNLRPEAQMKAKQDTEKNGRETQVVTTVRSSVAVSPSKVKTIQNSTLNGSTSAMTSPRRGIPANHNKPLPANMKQKSPLRPMATTPTLTKIPVTRRSSSTASSEKVLDVVDLVQDEDPNPQASSQPNRVRIVRQTQQAHIYKPKSNNMTTVPRALLVAPGARLIPVSAVNGQLVQRQQPLHPAPVPAVPLSAQPSHPSWKKMPPQPELKLSKRANDLVLQWKMGFNPQIHADISAYQIYAYQENSSSPITSALWKKVGDVKALPLPMACTLSQFQKGHTYHFTVRAKDKHDRTGGCSEPQKIAL